MKLKNAPVVEVVIGAQFSESALPNQLIFDFYQKIRNQFPLIQEHPPLLSIIEKINEKNENYLTQNILSRKFFLTQDQTKLIQIQPNRLLLNWRKNTENTEYPHFNNVLNEFLNIYTKINQIMQIDNYLNQLEVTYVDHIILEDFDKVDFNLTGILSVYNFSRTVKNFEGQISFPIGSINGNIILNIKNAIRNSDQKKLFVVETTCRGFNQAYSIQKWFDLAHNELVSFFEEILTPLTKSKWGYTK
ncbi:MAG: TIGR04255 family protein [Saprospiraceae bacterium]